MKRLSWIFVGVVVIASLAFASIASADAGGAATVRDSKASSDSIQISFTGLTPPAAGKVYVGWLVSDDGKTMVNTGPLTVAADGSVTASYTSPTGDNLIGLYAKFVVTAENQADAAGAAPKGQAVFEAPGATPAGALTHVRHLAYQWPAAPNKTGFAVGTLSQAKLLSQHAHLAQTAVTAGDLAMAKQHAEHVVNITEGSKGPNYGDLNKDGKAENPGDGFGLLEYAKGAAEHAGFAASVTDASTYIKLHAVHVTDTANNVIGWATTARDDALALLKAADIATATPIAADMVKNADLALNGNSTQPVKGQGGATTTFVHAQNMGSFNLNPASMNMAPAAAPAAASLPKTGDRLPVEQFAILGGALVAAALVLRRRLVNGVSSK